MKKLMKIGLWFLVVLLVLLVSSLIFIQTPLFRSIVASQLEERLSKALNAEVLIGSIGGNFFSRVSFSDLSIRENEQPLLELSYFSIDYRLLPLLRKRLQIESIIIDGLELTLIEDEEGWNFERIFPADQDKEEVKEPDDDKEVLDFGWDLVLRQLSLKNINILAETSGDDKSYGVKDLNLDLSFSVIDENLKLNLNHTNALLNIDDHLIKLNEISSLVRMTNHKLELESFLLETENINITASGTTMLDFEVFDFELDIYSESLRDASFATDQFQLDRPFQVTGFFKGSSEQLSARLHLQEEESKLDLTLDTSNLLYTKEINDLVYNLKIKFDNFQPTRLLVDQTNQLHLNGDIELSGKGTDYLTAELILKAYLYDSYFNSEMFSEALEVSSLELSSTLYAGSLSADLALAVDDFVTFKSEISLGDVENFGDLSLIGEVSNLNLGLLNLDLAEEEVSDISFKFTAKSRNPFSDTIELKLDFEPSNVFGLAVNELQIDLSINQEDIEINRLLIDVEENFFSLSGRYSFSGESDLDYQLQIVRSEPFRQLFLPETDGVATHGELNGNLSGVIPNDFSLTGNLSLFDNSFGDMGAEKIVISYKIEQDAVDNLSASIDLSIADVNLGELMFEGLTLTADYKDDQVELVVNLEENQQRFIEIMSQMSWNDEFKIVISRLHITYDQLVWDLAEDQSTIVYSDNGIAIDSFTLSSQEQSISAKGVFSAQKESNLSLELSNIDLIYITDYLKDFPVKSGLLNFVLTVQGESSNLDIETELSINDVTFGELTDIDLTASIDYKPEREYIEGSISLTYLSEEYLTLELSIPALVTFNSFEYYDDRNLSLKLTTTDIDLTLIDGLVEGVIQTGGRLTAELTVDRSSGDLKPSGFVTIRDGTFRVPELGNTYRDFNLSVEISESAVELKEFSLTSRDGTFSGKGSIALGETLSPDDIVSVNFDFTSNSFPVMTTDAIDIVMSSNLKISGTPMEPNISGSITLPRGRIDLSKLEGSGFSDSAEQPLLVKAREEQLLSDGEELDEEQPEVAMPSVSGQLTVDIPRNFWIRSPEMNIELGGNLRILIDGEDIEIFGSVNTLRGFYVFYGRRFNIVTGEVIFAGGDIVDPALQMEAIYTFRGLDMTRNELKLNVSGSLEDLEIAFQLNNQELEEADAISYIIFGRSFDELTQGEQGQVSSQAMVIGGFFANRLTNQLSSVLGERFRFDVLEFSSDTATSQIGIEAGKYLTDKLFVSYKRDFSFSDTKEPVYEEILVEYEIAKNIFLQALKGDSKSTGLDIVWRLRWR